MSPLVPTVRPTMSRRAVRMVVAACLTIAAALTGSGLTRDAGAAAATPPDVLIVHTADFETANLVTWVGQLTATSAFGTIDLFDAQVATPTAADLTGYEIVITFSNEIYLDPDAVGDVLADFVDAGGRVVEAAWSFACVPAVSWGLGGRWQSDGYAPIYGLPNSCDGFSLGTSGTTSMTVTDPSSPYLAGVGAIANVNIGINIDMVLRSGATLLAEWDDPASTPLAVMGTNCVAAINIFPPEVIAFDATSQASANRLFVNMATLPCSGGTSPTTSTTTTTTTSGESPATGPTSAPVVAPNFAG